MTSTIYPDQPRECVVRLASIRRDRDPETVTCSYCITDGCLWKDDGTGFPHSQGEAHVLMTGHCVRVAETKLMKMEPQR
ncbi:MAG TPA: hypothetical protein VF506_14545 [Streptosporangiaceae bacterium]